MFVTGGVFRRRLEAIRVFLRFVLKKLMYCVSAAYKHADGKKIDGRRVLVDVERARTVKGWLPRRLGKKLPVEKNSGKSQSWYGKTCSEKKGEYIAPQLVGNSKILLETNRVEFFL